MVQYGVLGCELLMAPFTDDRAKANSQQPTKSWGEN